MGRPHTAWRFLERSGRKKASTSKQRRPLWNYDEQQSRRCQIALIKSGCFSFCLSLSACNLISPESAGPQSWEQLMIWNNIKGKCLRGLTRHYIYLLLSCESISQRYSVELRTHFDSFASCSNTLFTGMCSLVLQRLLVDNPLTKTVAPKLSSSSAAHIQPTPFISSLVTRLTPLIHNEFIVNQLIIVSLLGNNEILYKTLLCNCCKVANGVHRPIVIKYMS